MSDWRDVMRSRAEADAQAESIPARSLDNATTAALEAVRLEIRALSTLIDYQRSAQ